MSDFPHLLEQNPSHFQAPQASGHGPKPAQAREAFGQCSEARGGIGRATTPGPGAGLDEPWEQLRTFCVVISRHRLYPTLPVRCRCTRLWGLPAPLSSGRKGLRAGRSALTSGRRPAPPPSAFRLFRAVRGPSAPSPSRLRPLMHSPFAMARMGEAGAGGPSRPGTAPRSRGLSGGAGRGRGRGRSSRAPRARWGRARGSFETAAAR